MRPWLRSAAIANGCSASFRCRRSGRSLRRDRDRLRDPFDRNAEPLGQPRELPVARPRQPVPPPPERRRADPGELRSLVRTLADAAQQGVEVLALGALLGHARTLPRPLRNLPQPSADSPEWYGMK